MFKNCVFKPSVDTVAWLKSAGIRALKTMAQVAGAMLTVGQAVTEVDWISVLSISATAGIISLLTSIGGIPEVAVKEESEEAKEEVE